MRVIRAELKISFFCRNKTRPVMSIFYLLAFQASTHSTKSFFFFFCFWCPTNFSDWIEIGEIIRPESKTNWSNHRIFGFFSGLKVERPWAWAQSIRGLKGQKIRLQAGLSLKPGLCKTSIKGFMLCSRRAQSRLGLFGQLVLGLGSRKAFSELELVAKRK